MSFFKTKIDKESIAEGGGGSKYISKSGIYDIEVLTAFMGGTSKSPVVELYIDLNGQKQPLYGNMRLTNNDGSENFGAKAFNKLLIVGDIEEVSDPVDAELPIGKKEASKDVAILEDIQDITCKVRVQMEYSVYKGDIKEKTIVKTFYREDGACAEEIVNETEVGVQLEKDMAYAENVTYKDGLDAEQVAQWITDKRPQGTAGNAPSGEAAKKPSFGGKKKFGK